MKKLLTMGVVLFAIICGISAFAANAVDVAGNLKRDGYLIINIKWTIDTTKYRAVTNEGLRESVYEEIWQEVSPKLVARTGSLASCTSKFTKISEGKKLVKTRPDGSKIYSYSAQIRFDCPQAVGVMPSTGSESQYDSTGSGYHDGFTKEAGSF